MNKEKQQVYDFWNKNSCGEDLYLSGADKAGYTNQAKVRYSLEGSMIFGLARFGETKGMKVLEVGVGLGADHQQFAEAGAYLWGIDMTERAVEHTRRRLAAFGLNSNITMGDAENLNFPNEMFDLVYSWGVLHHTPDTPKAISEVFRVLKPGGEARIMIYHKWSIIGFMLYLRYAIFRFNLFKSISEIYAKHLESPGTKAYSVVYARELFSAFREVNISTPLTHGDLLESQAGQRHQGILLNIARKLWPRWFLRKLMPNSGLFMIIESKK